MENIACLMLLPNFGETNAIGVALTRKDEEKLCYLTTLVTASRSSSKSYIFHIIETFLMRGKVTRARGRGIVGVLVIRICVSEWSRLNSYFFLWPFCSSKERS